MNKEALGKTFFLFTRSKILLPGFLLLIAWIITIFTFYIYQTPKTSVEGIAIKKFSNLSPSPITTPIPTPIVVVYKKSYSTISVTPIVTVFPQVNANSPTTSPSNVSNSNSYSGANTVTGTPASPTVTASPPAPTMENTVINTPAPDPTSAPAGNGSGESSNCVHNGAMVICQTFSPQVSPAGSSIGGSTTISTGNSANLNGVSVVSQAKPNN